MKEYTTDYNGMNDWKVLMHIDSLKAIVDKKPLPPVSVDTDPSNVCQQSCVYCNAYIYRKKTGFEQMPPGHLLKLADFYKKWGVKSTCIAGGGEPLINPETREMIPRLYKNDVEVGVITNGVLLDEDYSENLTDGARFCGVSFDGDNEKTYEIMRGKNHFKKVLNNVKKLNELRIKKNSNIDTNLKFLIHPYNYKEIYGVAKLAKEIGCCGIHIRPAGIKNVPGVKDPMKNWTQEQLNEYSNGVNDIIEKTWELSDKNFNVNAVRHKFGPTLQKVIKFNKCRCTPLAGVFGSDGWFHLCFSMRGRKGFRLARHIPDPENIMKIWGSDKHLKLMEQIDPNECMRCAFTRYNEVIEECVMEDKMFRNFL